MSDLEKLKEMFEHFSLMEDSPENFEVYLMMYASKIAGVISKEAANSNDVVEAPPPVLSVAYMIISVGLTKSGGVVDKSEFLSFISRVWDNTVVVSNNQSMH